MSRTKFYAAGIALLVIGIVLGAGATSLLSGGAGAPVEGEARVYYVVPAEWTFSLYDENWRPVERIEVNVGERVLLVVVPKSFAPPELYESLRERFIENAVARGLLASEEEFEAFEEEAYRQLGREVFGVEYLPHGVAIEGYEDVVNVTLEDGGIVVIEFVADRPGSYDIYCSLFCGWGHGFMRLSNALVVTG